MRQSTRAPWIAALMFVGISVYGVIQLIEMAHPVPPRYDAPLSPQYDVPLSLQHDGVARYQLDVAGHNA
jgi:hypothetical protein